MRKIAIGASILLFAAVLGYRSAYAANPDKVKIGILLPLTGPFAAVAETQKEGAQLALDVVNKRGGLAMPWGKVLVEGIVADDEAKLDVGVRRYRYLVSEGAVGVGGQTWGPMAFAINSVVMKEPMPYFPVNVFPKDALKKGALAPTTFATATNQWTVGYMAGSAATKTLGKKRIFFLARSDSWGWDIRDGVYAAAKENGAEIVGYDEVPLGTNEFTTVLQKVKAAKPDIFIAAQFGADAVALLNQVNQMGLKKEMTIFNAFITNVVAKGLAPDALDGVYAMHFFYHDMTGIEDKAVVESAKAYSDLYRAKYNKPPDAYATIAYIAYSEMLRAFEAAKSFEPAKVAAALMSNNGAFTSVKGPARWREDHVAVYKYAAFLVKGKGAAERSGDWDLFRIVNHQGGDAVMPTLSSLGY